MSSSSNNGAVVVKKLNEDDILEIIVEHFWENGSKECKDLLNSKAAVFGSQGKDLRVVCIFGDSEDNRIHKWNMLQLDKETEFNGDHSFLEKHPEFHLKPNKR